MEVSKFTNCKWTDKFGSLEVYKIVKWTDKFGSLEVCKIVKWTDKFVSLKNLNLNLKEALVCREVVHYIELQTACGGPSGHSSPLGCVLLVMLCATQQYSTSLALTNSTLHDTTWHHSITQHH